MSTMRRQTKKPIITTNSKFNFSNINILRAGINQSRNQNYRSFAERDKIDDLTLKGSAYNYWNWKCIIFQNLNGSREFGGMNDNVSKMLLEQRKCKILSNQLETPTRETLIPTKFFQCFKLFTSHTFLSILLLITQICQMRSRSVGWVNFLTAFFWWIWFPFTKIQSIYSKRLSVQKNTERRVLFSKIWGLVVLY